MSKSKRRQAKNKQSNNRIVQFSIVALVSIGIIAGIIFLPSLQADTSQAQTASISQNNNQVPQVEPVTNRTSSNPYEGIPGPEDWTDNTPVQIYNRLNGLWEDKTYGDVGPDMEFIVGDYVYATMPENGVLFLKPELDITKLAETDQAFTPDDWRMPKPDDIVKVFRSDDPHQQKGHWLLKDVAPNSEVIFQGRVWSWELELENQRFVVRDTGNVFAEVTAVHKQVHEGDVLALTVRYETCGKLGLITGSEEHPFYVLEKEDYIPMVELLPGMELKTDNGAQATVVELKSLPEAMELYNLTVAHVHNYYIFPSEDEPGILVHNAGCGGRIPLIGGGTDLPDGVRWGNVNQIQHYHPPDVPYKQERVAKFLEEGYDPTQPIPIMIEADGTWVAVGGNHRLARVKELGYDEIPVRILYDKSQ